MNVGELRKALEGVPDEMIVTILATEPNRVTRACVTVESGGQLGTTRHLFTLRAGDEVLCHDKAAGFPRLTQSPE